jgi:hypothetical protein
VKDRPFTGTVGKKLFEEWEHFEQSRRARVKAVRVNAGPPFSALLTL